MTALEMTNSAVRLDAYGELRTPASKSASPALSNRVFVVHGHDSGLKTDVERFLREVGLEPVVLHREPDQGATIIEKFEKHSDDRPVLNPGRLHGTTFSVTCDLPTTRQA